MTRRRPGRGGRADQRRRRRVWRSNTRAPPALRGVEGSTISFLMRVIEGNPMSQTEANGAGRGRGGGGSLSVREDRQAARGRAHSKGSISRAGLAGRGAVIDKPSSDRKEGRANRVHSREQAREHSLVLCHPRPGHAAAHGPRLAAGFAISSCDRNDRAPDPERAAADPRSKGAPRYPLRLALALAATAEEFEQLQAQPLHPDSGLVDSTQALMRSSHSLSLLS